MKDKAQGVHSSVSVRSVESRRPHHRPVQRDRIVRSSNFRSCDLKEERSQVPSSSYRGSYARGDRLTSPVESRVPHRHQDNIWTPEKLSSPHLQQERVKSPDKLRDSNQEQWENKVKLFIQRQRESLQKHRDPMPQKTDDVDSVSSASLDDYIEDEDNPSMGKTWPKQLQPVEVTKPHRLPMSSLIKHFGYEASWVRFYKWRKEDLMKEGKDPKDYDFEGEWASLWEKVSREVGVDPLSMQSYQTSSDPQDPRLIFQDQQQGSGLRKSDAFEDRSVHLTRGECRSGASSMWNRVVKTSTLHPKQKAEPKDISGPRQVHFRGSSSDTISKHGSSLETTRGECDDPPSPDNTDKLVTKLVEALKSDVIPKMLLDYIPGIHKRLDSTMDVSGQGSDTIAHVMMQPNLPRTLGPQFSQPAMTKQFVAQQLSTLLTTLGLGDLPEDRLVEILNRLGYLPTATAASQSHMAQRRNTTGQGSVLDTFQQTLAKYGFDVSSPPLPSASAPPEQQQQRHFERPSFHDDRRPPPRVKDHVYSERSQPLFPLSPEFYSHDTKRGIPFLD